MLKTLISIPQITPLAYRVSLQTCLRLDVQHEVNCLFCFLDLKKKVQTNTATACIWKAIGWQHHLQYPISPRVGINLIYVVLYSSSLRSCPIPKHLRLLRSRIGKSFRSTSFTTCTAGKRNQASYFQKQQPNYQLFSVEAVSISVLVLFHFVDID